MSTRFKSNSKGRFGIGPLPTGYEKSYGSPEFSVPPCGIEDVDTSLFRLFEEEISPAIKSGDAISKVPIIFAAGEKWAMLKRGRPLRDRNNTLLLPLVTIMRTELNQTIADDVTGRGINQQTGELVVRRRLDKSDRGYQNLINKLFIKNQDNLAVNTPASEDMLATERDIGRLSTEKFVKDGAYLKPHVLQNIYETIVVPSPQFFTARYQVTVWAQYTQHSNQILEKIFSSFLPQGQSWRLDTPKGYWFIAKVDDGSYASETNFEDMSQQERFIKHSFTVSVPAYFFSSTAPGVPVAVKRYVSSPSIIFETSAEGHTGGVDSSSLVSESEYTLGSDDPTLPIDTHKNNRRDQRSIGWTEQKIYPVFPDASDPEEFDANKRTDDPAAENLPRGYTVKVVNKTSAGETVYSGVSLGDLDIVIIK